jgi:hypothetical protein
LAFQAYLMAYHQAYHLAYLLVEEAGWLKLEVKVDF